MVTLLIACLTALSGSAQAMTSGERTSKGEQVDAYVREQMKARNIPGLSLAVVRDGNLVLAKGYGMANLELSVPATEKTAYSIASVTKTFTALATMMLVEDDSVSLDDQVSKHLPGLPAAWQPISIRHLLDHTSGIRSFTNNDVIPCSVGKSEHDYERGDVLKEVACLPLDFPTGSAGRTAIRATTCSGC